ncbi:1-acyl-sn-glycerol-3-phosphate acyltransferase [Lentibacter sp. XHP0401]|uniref:1-acyl-sn-glycerol-3-phosphate acyltransferase n=1 Tax=Lentibacter sp. XHP0401 TaxID=2984334 RepID=UPI0021E9984D|nr:1-acyl-sn-glycerol-3-phosphate acyltransferase [Lentibacter sp. XHP0401]MCV2894073.1 1-acyl-sn-glycerol-3-phosphate acyltransferase [Lentibacter sp. XHP0401]
MFHAVEIPLWLLLVILLFAAVTFASHFLFPSVRWFFRRRMEKAVAKLNERLERPIEPFKLARRHDMIQRLIYDGEVWQAISDHAKKEGVPENVAFERARRYAREIVPSFSATMYYGFAIRLSRFLSRRLYRVRLGHHARETLAAVDRDATVVFVMNHRSNMDYVLVTYLAAEQSALSYAVGEWARVWPLSRLIRAMGAYFIRRKSRGDLYRRVLARYVALATEGGVTQAVFPEGGLSLDGALAKPKLGILSYIVNGYDAETRDVVFVPVAINYDRVFEDKILVAAGERGDRRFRARISVVVKYIFRIIWRWLLRKYHRFGYAAVSFGEPLSLRGFSDGGEIVVEDLAADLMRRIGDVVPVLPVPLAASVFVRAEGPMTREQYAEAFQALVEAMPDAHIHAPREDMGYAVEYGLRNLEGRGFVAEQNGFYVITEGGAPLVRYYANSIAHLLR